jgi:hypothetical protein
VRRIVIKVSKTFRALIAATTVLLWLVSAIPAAAEPWRRHVIDNSARGADGVRLADINRDGLDDIVTPWEEGGRIRLYLNPGPKGAKKRWPAVTVGEVRSPEDAVLVDLDSDGALDVISSCEGKTRSMFVHWAPKDRSKLLDPTAWKTEPLPATVARQQWMFAAPAQIDGRNALDLFAGGKGAKAAVVWLEAPAKARDLSAWRLHTLASAGWIMSLVPHDLDADGDLDVIVSDRKGPNRSVYWLQNPGRDRAVQLDGWRRHEIGGSGEEVMFLTVADLDRDGATDIVTATRTGKIHYFRRRPGKATNAVKWDDHIIKSPFGITGGKAVHAADIDLDGRLDLVHTAETGRDRGKPGVCWLRYEKSPTESAWKAHDISGPEGSKFDLVATRDLDGDGDLDVIACEERSNLGVIWYENPTR